MDRNVANLIAFLVLFGGLFAPVPPEMSLPAQRLLAVTAFMATLWLTQSIPIGVTSLIPIVAFPLLGIDTTEQVCGAYAKSSIFLLLGGFVIALGIEKWGLHRRIALQIVRLIGTNLKRTVLGFMLATAFLSMWISNTASTLMMLPIGLAFLTSLEDAERARPQRHQVSDSRSPLPAVFCLAIAYSASIGGLTTLVGTPANIQFRNIWASEFPDAPGIGAGEFMFAALPIGLILLLAAWLLLTWKLPGQSGRQVDRQFFRQQLLELGQPSRAEKTMSCVFATAAILWLTRKPILIGSLPPLPAWGPGMTSYLQWLGTDEQFAESAVGDATVAILVAIAMFFIPVARNDQSKPIMLMDWETARTLPWEILLLLGGGFAIASGFETTGLSQFAGRQITEIGANVPLWCFIGLVCLTLTFLTEFTSNVATVSVLLPILAATAVDLDLDPRLVMLPATFATTCAFMLPIGTPPNAVVFASGKVSIGQMARYGLILNLIGIVVITAATAFRLVQPVLAQ